MIDAFIRYIDNDIVYLVRNAVIKQIFFNESITNFILKLEVEHSGQLDKTLIIFLHHFPFLFAKKI